MIIDQSLNKQIEKLILEKEQAEEKIASNKLTASILGWALQWQVLKCLGIPQKEKEIYIIKKFIRGRQVENYLADLLSLEERQKEVEYQKVLGLLDGIYNFEKYGKIPVEIKSVANSKFRHIQKENKPDESHLLQAGLYALALKKDFFSIVYVASDDLRTIVFIEETKKIKNLVDGIIETVNFYLKNKIIPEFKPRYDWQLKDDYNPYPEFKNLSEKEIKKLLKNKYKLEI